MPLKLPQIDDRTYQEILDEALARIPVHNPEWTNFNDSDPGVTLVQLFAFMTENLLYRSNLIPERNRVKFLKLLGVPLQPATSAQGIVTFSNTKGPIQAQTFSADMELYAGQTPFRTQSGLDVLPVEAHVFYKSRLSGKAEEEAQSLYIQLYTSFAQQDTQFSFYETRPLDAPASGAVYPVLDLAKETIDGSLWIALLARSADLVEQTREAIANKELTLGILPALTDAARVLLPGGQPSTAPQTNLVYEVPIGGQLSDDVEQRVARYRPLDTRPSTDLLAEPGVVHISLPDRNALRLWENLEPLEQGVGAFPPSLEDTDISDRVVTWVRIRMPEAQPEQQTASQLSARISWAGINAARIIQRTRVFSEFLGEGNGEPDQAVALVNTPVIRESVALTVNGEIWEQIDDLAAAPSEVPVRSLRLAPGARPAAQGSARVYTIDRESGEIRFGNGIRGARPPFGSIIQASYDYGGGRQGMVGIGAINKGPALPAGVKVTNPIPTWGGDEAERVDEGERRIPRYLQHRDRMVSETDFAEIVQHTPGVELGRVEVLPLFHPDLPDLVSPGVVTIMVIPAHDPVQPEAPLPDRLFLDSICAHLNPRRLVTTEVHVRGPVYVPISVSVGFDVIAGQDVPPVREAVKAAIRSFLSPLVGGFDQTGWPLERAITRLELWAVATRVAGVSKVNELLLSDSTGADMEQISLTALQLPRLLSVAAQTGDAQPLPGDTDGAPPTTGTATRIVPVPVVPPDC